MATFKTKQNPHDVYEWARLNPNLAARRIMGWDLDSVAMFNVIEAIKAHCVMMLDLDAATLFESELKANGWGKP